MNGRSGVSIPPPRTRHRRYGSIVAWPLRFRDTHAALPMVACTSPPGPREWASRRRSPVERAGSFPWRFYHANSCGSPLQLDPGDFAGGTAALGRTAGGGTGMGIPSRGGCDLRDHAAELLLAATKGDRRLGSRVRPGRGLQGDRVSRRGAGLQRSLPAQGFRPWRVYLALPRRRFAGQQDQLESGPQVHDPRGRRGHAHAAAQGASGPDSQNAPADVHPAGGPAAAPRAGQGADAQAVRGPRGRVREAARLAPADRRAPEVSAGHRGGR